VTDAVIEEVKLWQGRPLEELYPIVYLDALMVKVRDEGHIQNKAIYVVLGVSVLHVSIFSPFCALRHETYSADCGSGRERQGEFERNRLDFVS